MVFIFLYIYLLSSFLLTKKLCAMEGSSSSTGEMKVKIISQLENLNLASCTNFDKKSNSPNFEFRNGSKKLLYVSVFQEAHENKQSFDKNSIVLRSVEVNEVYQEKLRLEVPIIVYLTPDPLPTIKEHPLNFLTMLLISPTSQSESSKSLIGKAMPKHEGIYLLFSQKEKIEIECRRDIENIQMHHISESTICVELIATGEENIGITFDKDNRRIPRFLSKLLVAIRPRDILSAGATAIQDNTSQLEQQIDIDQQFSKPSITSGLTQLFKRTKSTTIPSFNSPGLSTSPTFDNRCISPPLQVRRFNDEEGCFEILDEITKIWKPEQDKTGKWIIENKEDIEKAKEKDTVETTTTTLELPTSTVSLLPIPDEKSKLNSQSDSSMDRHKPASLLNTILNTNRRCRSEEELKKEIERRGGIPPKKTGISISSIKITKNTKN